MEGHLLGERERETYRNRQRDRHTERDKDAEGLQRHVRKVRRT